MFKRICIYKIKCSQCRSEIGSGGNRKLGTAATVTESGSVPSQPSASQLSSKKGKQETSNFLHLSVSQMTIALIKKSLVILLFYVLHYYRKSKPPFIMKINTADGLPHELLGFVKVNISVQNVTKELKLLVFPFINQPLI